MLTLKPGGTQDGILHAFNSDAAISLHEAIGSIAKPVELDQLTQRLWRDHVAGSISEIDAEFLDRCIQRRRPVRLTAADLPRSAGRLASRLAPRKRVKRPDGAREAARRRKRMLAGSSALPPELRCDYTEAERAVLCIVAGEIKRQGFCDFPIDKIAALAGVCRTSVQTAMHEGRRLGHLRISERPRPGRKNLPNIVEIISRRWCAWLRGKAPRPIGSKKITNSSTTKNKDIKQKRTSPVENYGASEWPGESHRRENKKSDPIDGRGQKNAPASRASPTAPILEKAMEASEGGR